MSSFKKVDGMIDSLQKQATGLRTLDGSAIEDFLSIAGYEDPAGGGGGGGGGDFSTAEVTVIGTWEIMAAAISEDTEEGVIGSFPSNSGNSPFTIILYKGKAYIPLEESDIIESSGDIEFNADANMWVVTGDCSITLQGHD